VEQLPVKIAGIKIPAIKILKKRQPFVRIYQFYSSLDSNQKM